MINNYNYNHEHLFITYLKNDNVHSMINITNMGNDLKNYTGRNFYRWGT